MPRVSLKTRYANLDGINKAEKIIAANLRGSLEGIGKRLITSAQTRMRENTRASKRSLRFVVRGRGLNLSLDVFSTLIQAFIDAYGLPKGTFPPYQQGTKLYAWAEKNFQEGFEGAIKHKASFNRRELRQRRKLSSGRNFRVREVKKVKGPRANSSQRMQRRDKDIRRFSFLAARSIFRKGIAPSYWNKTTLEANANRIMLDLQNGLQRAVNQINRGG